MTETILTMQAMPLSRQIRRRQTHHGVCGDRGGKNTGYGIVTGNGIPAHILRPVLRDVPVATDIGKMRENMWMKAGGNLKRNIIRHP